jgi:hypothetical protein
MSFARYLIVILLFHNNLDMRNRDFYSGDYDKHLEHRKKNRIFFGVGVALVGAVLFLKALGLLNFDLEFSWPVILIVVGLFAGLKSGFRNHAWWILMLIGIANLTPQFTILGKPSRHLIWPVALIIGGIVIALRPPRRRCHPGMRHGHPVKTSINSESDFDIDVAFGGRKEVVSSKEFKGGSANITFGGCELNLTQADFTEPSVAIDCKVTFGGLEIIVPSHWDVKNEISPSFGAVEDERTILTNPTGDIRKILILRGTCVFGGIELKSY